MDEFDADEEYCDKFDNDRILRGEVPDEEVAELLDFVVIFFLEKAKRERKSIVATCNREEYEALRQSGKLFEGEVYYLLLDEEREYVQDLSPFLYHALDTNEGLFLAKYLLFCESDVNVQFPGNR